MASVARSRWFLAIVLIAGIAVAWWMRRRPPQYSAAYVGERSATVWSTTAQVRQTVTTLSYGDKVSLIRQAGEQAEIRTATGIQGWVDARLLMTPEMWRSLADLAASARSMPVQAVGHTRALSNVHAQPNRDAARIFQFGADVPLLVLNRRLVPVPRSTEAQPSKVQDEPWLFVLRAQPQNQPQQNPTAATEVAVSTGTTVGFVSSGSPSEATNAAPQPDAFPIAGWILARFVELDPPAPIPDYASAADLRVVAWMTLDTVPATPADLADAKPQYLVVGNHGADTLGCDFNSFRVFTWGVQRQRYETAYVANNDVCGHLPILVQKDSAGPQFRFRDTGEVASGTADQEAQDGSERVYQMKQTIVREVTPNGLERPEEHGARSAARRKRL